MRFLEYLKNLVRNDNKGSIPARRKSDAERLFEIEMEVKIKPSCACRVALEDLLEIHNRLLEHIKQEKDGYDKGR